MLLPCASVIITCPSLCSEVEAALFMDTNTGIPQAQGIITRDWSSVAEMEWAGVVGVASDKAHPKYASAANVLRATTSNVILVKRFCGSLANGIDYSTLI